MLSIETIRAKRQRLMDRMRVYAKKHYDGSPMLPGYNKLTKALGARSTSDDPIFTAEYWKNPKNIDRQSKNKNPIIGVDENFDLVWAVAPRTAIKPNPSPIVAPYTIKDNPVIIASKGISNNPVNPKFFEPVQTQPQTNKSYYKFIMSWSDASLSADNGFIAKMHEFFQSLGLEQCFEEPGTIEYKFKGSEDSYTMLKRVAMTMIDTFNDQNVEIGIYGNKLNIAI